MGLGILLLMTGCSVGVSIEPDGIVLCYERYEIRPGASSSSTFEISYEWFADILNSRYFSDYYPMILLLRKKIF